MFTTVNAGNLFPPICTSLPGHLPHNVGLPSLTSPHELTLTAIYSPNPKNWNYNLNTAIEGVSKIATNSVISA